MNATEPNDTNPNAPGNPVPAFASREERDEYFRRKYFDRRGGGDQPAPNQKMAGPPIKVEMTPAMVALFMGCMKIFGAAAWTFYFVRNLFALITAVVILGGLIGWLTS